MLLQLHLENHLCAVLQAPSPAKEIEGVRTINSDQWLCPAALPSGFRPPRSFKNSEARLQKDEDDEDTCAPSGCSFLAQLRCVPLERDSGGQGGGRDRMEEDVKRSADGMRL
jgi:hypothetical protein